MTTQVDALNRSERSKVLIEHWIPSALLAAILLPRLFMRGMFFDGITYGAIARNMAEGYGSFWNPYYTDSLHTFFRDQPPLALWLQGQFGRFFSDAFFVDALWSAGLALIILNLSIALTRAIEAPNRSFAPLIAGLFLATSPLFIWTAQNNLLELTLTVFVLLAAACAWFATKSKNPISMQGLAVLVGFFVFLGLLAKGPVAAFPLALPFLWACLSEPKCKALFTKQWILISATSTVVLILALVGLAFYAPSQSFFKDYLEGQVYNSLAGTRERASSRFHLVASWFEAMAIPLLTAIILSLFRRHSFTRFAKNIFPLEPKITFAVCIALAGSLPLLLSPKQSAFYLVPSLPFFFSFFALAFSRLLPLSGLSNRFMRFLMIVSPIALITTALFAAQNYGKPRRTPELYAALDRVKNHIPVRASIEVCDRNQISDWTLIAVVQRELSASLVFEPSSLLPYRLSEPSKPCPLSSRCRSLYKSSSFLVDQCD